MKMQTIRTGIIVNDMIRLDGPVGLPDGQPVQVVLIPQEAAPELTEDDIAFLDGLMRSREYTERVHRSAGALADLPQSEFDDLDEIIAARSQAFFRDNEE